MNEMSIFFIISVFTAGLLSFFSPCIFPLIPVYISILSDRKVPIQAGYPEAAIGDSALPAKKNRRMASEALLGPLLFTAGLATCFVILGFGAGSFGSWLNSRLLTLVGGALVTLLGLFQMELISLPWLQQTHKVKLNENRKNRWLRPYFLGVTFSLGWTPCIGPIFGSVLLLASQSSTAVYGALLMAIYTAGLAVPFFFISLFAETVLSHYRKLNRYLPAVKKIGGLLLVLMGILLMTGQLNILYL